MRQDKFQGEELTTPTAEVVERFEAKMVPEPMSGCFLWTGAVGPGGYGNFWFEKKCRKAHRVALAIANGGLDRGLDVMHICDNTLCVNPQHLRAVPTAINVQDSFRKGRSHRRGNANPHTKVPDEWLPIVLRLNGCGVSTEQIAFGLNIQPSQVRRIVRGERQTA